MSYFNLNQTYQLETKKSQEYIIGTLGIIIDLKKSEKGLSTYFQYPDYTSILLSENKIIINNVIYSAFKTGVIGEICVLLTTTPNGTTVVAYLRPYPPPTTLIIAGMCGGLLMWFLFYYEQAIKLSKNEFIFVVVGAVAFCCLYFLIAPKMKKNSMKSYLDTVFFQLQLGGEFVLVEKE